MTSPPPKTPLEAGRLKRAKTLWLQSGADLKEAKREARAQRWLRASVLALQGATNALAVFAELGGHFQRPHAKISALLEFGRDHPELAGLGEDCTKLEEATGWDPFRPPPEEQARKMGEALLQAGVRVRRQSRLALRRSWPAHFSRFS